MADALRRKKTLILLMGVALYFLTSMSKVMVPGTIFDDLLRRGLDARQIARLGAFYMYAYAASQLLLGIFSDRYGGVRLLLWGGGSFALGLLGFPYAPNLALMLVCRVMTGFGAGIVFLGVAKLLDDLFPESYALAMGLIMVVASCGPVCGTLPTVVLVRRIGWQAAMALPGVLAVAAMAGIVARMRGTLKPAVPGNAFRALGALTRSRPMWMLCLASSIVFGCYYMLVAQIGQKCLSDCCGMGAKAASTCIMCLTILVAANNLTCNWLLRLFGQRRKPVAGIGLALLLTGALTGWLAFRSAHPHPVAVVAAFACIAFPAGFFPLFAAIAKELNPPEQVGLSVAYLNFLAFVFIAAFQNIAGHILHGVAPVDGAYPPNAYLRIFGFTLAAAVAAAAASFGFRETGRRIRVHRGHG